MAKKHTLIIVMRQPEQIDIGFVIDTNGKKVHEFSDIQAIPKVSQKCANTVVVLAGTDYHHRYLSLPKNISQRKAKAIAMGLVEENLVTDKDKNEISITLQSKQQGAYAFIMEKARLAQYEQSIHEWQLPYSTIICLNRIIHQSHAHDTIYQWQDFNYINTKEGCYCIPKQLADSIANDIPADLIQKTITTKQVLSLFTNKILKDKKQWIKQFNIHHTSLKVSSWAKHALGMAMVISGIYIGQLGFSVYQYSQHHDTLKAQIHHLYYEFFPNAKNVVSPKARINQLLTAQSQPNHDLLFMLLDAIAKAKMQQNQLIIDDLKYINQKITLTASIDDAKNIVPLKRLLQNQAVKVEEKGVKKVSDRVIMTLDVYYE